MEQAGKNPWMNGMLACAIGLLIAGCGGGGGDSGGGGGGGSGSGGGGGGVTAQYTLGGSVAGLGAGGVVELSNGSDKVSVNANGTFTFPAKLASGASYNVAASAAGYACSVANGTGTVGQANVTSVAVTCSSNGSILSPASTVLAGVESVMQAPAGLAKDAAGNAYVIDYDNQVILKIAPAGAVTILAGSKGVWGNSDGAGTAATFRFDPTSRLVVDADGSLAVTDTCNGAVRKVSPSGVVTTIAGGSRVICGNVAQAPVPASKDGSGAAAQFAFPSGIVSDGAGGYIVADVQTPQTLRKVSPAGTVTSVGWSASTGPTQVYNLARDNSNGTLYASDVNQLVWRFDNNFQPIFVAGIPNVQQDGVDGVRDTARFARVRGMTVGTDHALYVADIAAVRKVTADGTVTTLAGSNTTRGTADGTAGDARFAGLASIATDVSGDLIVADGVDNTLRIVTMAGVVSTHVGTPMTRGYTDGVGSVARFGPSRQPAIDASGNVYVADVAQHVIRKITPDKSVSLFAGTPGTAGATDGAIASATFKSPTSVAVGRAGELYVSDATGLRKIANGTVSTLMTKANVLQSIAVDANGNVAVTDATGFVYGITADGVQSTLIDTSKVNAVVNKVIPFMPRGLAFDANGNLYVGDAASLTVLKLTKAGALGIFAGTPMVAGNKDGAPGTGTLGFYGITTELAIDASGNLYLTGQGKLRKISPDGVISTPNLEWLSPQLRGVAYGNGKLVGTVKHAVLQIPLQ